MKLGLILWITGTFSSVIAQVTAQPGPLDSIPQLLNLGMLGVVLILLLTGKLSVGSELDHSRKETEDAREDARKLRDAIIEDVVPAMTRMNDLAAKMVDSAMRHDKP
jgi:hypothetical protein